MNKPISDGPTSDERIPDSPAFPLEAWEHIRVEAPDSLALYTDQNRGHLKVTLTNNSKWPLNPSANRDIVFSFRLLDAQGELVPLEGVRSRLTRALAPGDSHSQIVTVIIPDKHFKEGASVRVGLLIEGEYWVETHFQDHPRTVKIHKIYGISAAETRRAAARQIWPEGRDNGLRWPFGTMLVAESHKLLYIPIAKCACTSLKCMMVELAAIERPDIAAELDVHFITDQFNTGAQLKDMPMDQARRVLSSEQYFKFGVLRDPFERLISAYLEKFVYERLNYSNLEHTRSVIAAIQKKPDIDLQRGITFDQFIDHIVRQDPFDLDPHWRPQHLYFRGTPHISRLFRLENMEALEAYLEINHGVKIALGHRNETQKSEEYLSNASGLLSCELDKLGAFNPDSFRSSKNSTAIERYYREDIALYSTAI